MNAAVANGATFLKRPARSLVARHVVAATLIVVAGGVLTVSGRAQEPAPMQAALVPIGADRDLRDPAVVTSQPAPEASGVAGRAPLFVRFNKPMAAASLTSQSVTLVGPRGAEPTQVAPLGALAVISPGQELLPGSRYTLFLNGALDNANQPLPLTAIGFDTAAKPAEVAAGARDAIEPPTVDRDAQLARLSSTERSAVAQADATADSDDWTPGTANFKGRWRADRKASPLQALPPLQAQLGATALAGQVLGMNGRAVAGVTLRVDGHEAVTDATGRFLVQGLAPGFVKMEIDGATANQPDSQYGYYAARIELKPRLTNVVPYVIWMPRLDPAGTIQISAPTTTETIVTSPRIPGLELRIPAGTVIRDRQGQIVTELNLTAIPVDRPPFPVPDLGVPVYFTVQPGGAVLESVTGQPGKGARLFYPNFRNEVPGARGTFWNYDPEDREWFIYGLGTISPDAKQAIPDPDVVIHELTGAMFNAGNGPGPFGPPSCSPNMCCPGGDGADSEKGSCDLSGDPVSLSTGQFDHTEHDVVLNDVTPIDVTRTYRSLDKNKRMFGIGMTYQYEVFLYSQNQWQEVDLILANGTRIHYVRTSPGTGSSDAIFESSEPGEWQHSIVARNLTRLGWDLSFRDGRKWFFRQFQPLSEMTDANGNVTKIVRDGDNGDSGNIIEIISPNGRTVDVAYNAAGLVSSMTDNLGRSFVYAYDAVGRMTSVTDPAGGQRTYTWDTTNNRITSIHDPNGNLVISNVYDSADRVQSQTLADGSTFSYAYTTVMGKITQVDVTDRRGTIRRVSFDSDGRIVQNTFALGLPEQRISNYEISNGRLNASVDPLNRRTEYLYDAVGNTTKITRLAGTAGAVSTNMTYDAVFSRPLTVSDVNGHTTTRAYDGKGNMLSVSDALGHATTFSYDSQGRMLTRSDALGRTTTTAYDGADVSSVIDPLGRQWQVVTDAVGRVIATVDPLGERHVHDWDELDRLASTTDALAGVTGFSYDSNGNLLSQADAKNHSTSYLYTAINTVQRIRDPRVKDQTRLYDAGGEVKQRIDRRGQLSATTYDALGRLKTESFGATSLAPTAYKSQIQYTWDAAGRLTQIVDRTCADPTGHPNCSSVASSNTIARSYDGLDRMVSETTPQGEVDYGYDNAGRRTTRTIKNGAPGSQVTQPVITYTYDNADRVTAIQQAAGTINGSLAQTISHTYDAANQRTLTTLANGSTITYSYDLAGECTAIVYKKADNTAIGDLLYSYDAMGRRTDVGGSLARMNIPAADVTDGSFDVNDRLTQWTGKTYTYDDQGNLTSDGTSTYVWDERNRLTSISTGGTTVASFQYDSLNRRTGKTIAGQTTGFLYDGTNVAQELLGTSNTATVKAHLLTGRTDELFLRLEGNTGANRQTVLADANNNTVMLLGSTQATLVSYTYDPYGVTTADVSLTNTQQFTGRENDNPGNAQGLYYYRARYYMPGIGRFIAEDPIGWASGQTNNYAYAGGDPINARDPRGLDTKPDDKPSPGPNPAPPPPNPPPPATPPTPAPPSPPTGPTAEGKACRAGCWGGGGMVCYLMAGGCGAGTLVTVGAAVIPCGAVLALVCGAGASLCSDACPP